LAPSGTATSATTSPSAELFTWRVNIGSLSCSPTTIQSIHLVTSSTSVGETAGDGVMLGVYTGTPFTLLPVTTVSSGEDATTWGFSDFEAVGRGLSNGFLFNGNLGITGALNAVFNLNIPTAQTIGVLMVQVTDDGTTSIISTINTAEITYDCPVVAVDNDGDGVLSTSDPNDNDKCVPNATQANGCLADTGDSQYFAIMASAIIVATGILLWSRRRYRIYRLLH